MTAASWAALAIVAWIGLLVLAVAMCKAAADADQIAADLHARSQAGTETPAAVDVSQDAMTPPQPRTADGRAAGPPAPTGRGR